MKKIVPALLLLFLIVNSSCKKETEALPITKENIVGSWQMTTKKMSATGIPEQDAFTNMDECERDNLYVFNPDDTFSYFDSGVTCDMYEHFLGLWELDGQAITFMGQTGSITKLKKSHMELTVSVTDATTQTTYSTKYSFRRL